MIPAAIAAANVQPVPWVLRVSMRSDSSVSKFPPSNNTSTAGPSRCPPLTTTLRGPISKSLRATVRIPSTSEASIPVSARASSRFGVMTVARGISRSMSVDTASGSSSASPLLAIITGSTTRGISVYPRSASATAARISVLASMPVLITWAPISVRTESICAATTSGDRLWTACTPRVFCAVTDVTADMPYTPFAEKVFRSAWMPAPPPESEPAMVSATGIICGKWPGESSG